MNNVYATKLQLVPVNEMVDCLRPRKAKLDIKLGMWVRVKRGNYGGDLGQIVEIPESGESVVVKLIPRLDYSKDTSSKRKKGSIRPPQKLFSTNDIKYRYFNLANAILMWFREDILTKVKCLIKMVI